MTRLSTVETMMPPITAVAIGARKAPPSPTPRAEGSIPADMAIEVITTGCARLCPASTTLPIESFNIAAKDWPPASEVFAVVPASTMRARFA